MTPSITPAETIVAFVGRCLRGPVNIPVTVRDFASFQRVFGGLWHASPLSYAVEHFFDHGGRCAVIVRVVNGGTPCTLTLQCGDEALTLESLVPGSHEFLRASVDYDNVPALQTDCFNLVIQRVREHRSEYIEEQETYRRISTSPDTHRFVGKELARSSLVKVRGTVPAQRPDATRQDGPHYAVSYVLSDNDGTDGLPLSDYDVIGSASAGSGLFALNHTEHIDYLYLPPLRREREVGASALLAAIHFCRRRHAMLIVDPPPQWTSASVALREMRDFYFYSDQAVMFFPRIMALDRLSGRHECFGNGGAVAGMLAHAEESCPPWAMNQTEPELALRRGVRLQVELNERERWRLATQGINALQTRREHPVVKLVRRTLSGGINSSADFGYVGTRRFALHVISSLERTTRWVMLTTPNRSMWSRLLRQVTEFLQGLVNVGAFPPSQMGREFFVICDERINPPVTEGVPEIRILIGFAAWHAEQYHTYMISHSVTGSSTRPVAVNCYQASSDVADSDETLPLMILK
ncbi:MAG TPA: hypothetical protein VG962_14800 [Steroidobacteraceae bacterium]|nr:hypothetical protein [Steroidobacteraceae bacterium]